MCPNIQTLTSNFTVNKDMFSPFSLFSFHSILKTLFRHKMHVKICARETRERWPLLTVEMRWMGIKRVQVKGALSWLVSWACRAGTREFCSTLSALVGPVQNIFSSPYTISIPLSPSPSKLGRQPCWVACLLVSIGLYLLHCPNR